MWVRYELVRSLVSSKFNARLEEIVQVFVLISYIQFVLVSSEHRNDFFCHREFLKTVFAMLYYYFLSIRWNPLERTFRKVTRP
jgi:hypothetical protein